MSLLGCGVSGEVFLCQDKLSKKKLALKVVKYREEIKCKSLLTTEVRIAAELKNNNIIRCYATYFLDNTINFVLEYMDKGALSDILKKVKIIPEKILGIITNQIIQGLCYMQTEKKIIHRDLKPSNILLNSKGYVKISDFGVSAMLEGSWEQKKTMIGTYIYMSPERIDADVYYLNSDIWSLGILIMECALGYYPYLQYNNFEPINNVWSLRDLIYNNDSPKFEGDFTNEFKDFLGQCLTKDKLIRPNSMMLSKHPFVKKYDNYNPNELAEWLKKI